MLVLDDHLKIRELLAQSAIADGHGGRLVLENRTPRGFSAALIFPV